MCEPLAAGPAGPAGAAGSGPKDSARELLAIDVRQRKGENLTGEEELAETPKQARRFGSHL